MCVYVCIKVTSHPMVYIATVVEPSLTATMKKCSANKFGKQPKG